MTLVPRVHIRLLLILSFAGLTGLTCFDSAIFAQTSAKIALNTEAYTIVQAPDGSSLCRGATPEEIRAMDVDSSSLQNLYPINHLEDFHKSGDRINVDDGSLPGLKIFLFATARLNNNPEAKQAFKQAAAAWEARIKTPMTVYINVDYGPDFFGIGTPPEPYDSDVIGSTRSRSITATYAAVRNNLIISASNGTESSLFNTLPSASVPTDIGSISSMSVSTSIARAIGLLDANADISSARPQIGFNSTFDFDFNPGDGLGGKMDFIAVATHEIGHALGFSSTSGASPASNRPAILDLFRIRPQIFDFTNAPRIMTAGGSQVFFAGTANTFTIGSINTSEAGLSTGGPSGSGGDGRQSGHWKDDNLSGGAFIGIMDPSISLGRHEDITDNDLKAFNFMGYNLEANTPPPPAPPPPPVPANNSFANAQVITGCNGSVSGTNVGASKEDGEPSHSPDNDLGGSSVWYQWTAPSTSDVTLTTAGSSNGFDTVLGVWTGTSVGGLSVVTRNDDVVLGQVTTSTVTFSATAGTTYRIAVDGWDGDEGNIVLNWTVANCSAPAQPTLQLNQSSYNIAEGTGSLDLLVNRSGDSSLPVTVNYTTTDAAAFLQNCNVTNGAATSRCDYVGVLGTLHFAANETSKTISIPVVDDTYAEGTESFFITLSNPTGGAVLGTNQRSTVQITDNGNDSAGQPNPIDNQSFFVRQHYIDFLSREPDPLSAGWITILNQCGAGDQSCRLTVSQGIYGSPEFRDRGYFIYKFYSVSLGRKPTYDEFNLDRARVSGFQTDAELEQSKVDFINDFISRAEFANIYNGLSNNAYVQRLYDTAGVSQVTTASGVLSVAAMQASVSSGKTRAQVLREIAESAEVSARFNTESTVVMHYFGYLRRDPDAQYQQWINTLNSTGDSRNVTSGFINSPEYRARFGQ